MPKFVSTVLIFVYLSFGNCPLPIIHLQQYCLDIKAEITIYYAERVEVISLDIRSGYMYLIHSSSFFVHR